MFPTPKSLFAAPEMGSAKENWLWSQACVLLLGPVLKNPAVENELTEPRLPHTTHTTYTVVLPSIVLLDKLPRS